MKYNPLEARCVFIDGPVAVYVHEAPEQEILDAYDNLRGVIEVAASQLDTAQTPLSFGEAKPPEFAPVPYKLTFCADEHCRMCRTPLAMRTDEMRHAGLTGGTEE